MYCTLPIGQGKIIRLQYQGPEAGAWWSSLQWSTVSACFYWMWLGVPGIRNW